MLYLHAQSISSVSTARFDRKMNDELIKEKEDVHILYEVTCYKEQKKIQQIAAEEGASLLDIFREYQVPVDAVCSGRGDCGKCRVKVTKGQAPVTELDQRFFTEQELSCGYRLACNVRIYGDLSVELCSDFTQIQALFMEQAAQIVTDAQNGSPKEAAIAVDLGSTTLAAVLLDTDGKLLAQASAVNSQRAYGSDVISRIQAANEGKQEQLCACICRDLRELFVTLLRAYGEPAQVMRIAIAGNTTMLHLLRGYSCEWLGQAPFAPVSLEAECLPFDSLFAQTEGCGDSLVYLLPGISTFVGADITAGLYSSGFWQADSHHPAFFIDLGTNGELAFGSRDGYVTTSTAAGPAFEGARLSCGVPGIPGAICKVSYLYHRVRIQTIGRKKPCGVCGTGAMEAAAALLSEGMMDADGLLAPQIFEKGMMLAKREDGSGIFLTQADIREIQMAKAAIRAGIEILYKRYQEMAAPVGREQVGRIYLAGGFGYGLSPETAVSIGLFPAEWKERVVPVGNTSLKGAVEFLTDRRCAGELEEIRGKNRSVRLESDADFQEIYVREMRFPRW